MSLSVRVCVRVPGGASDVFHQLNVAASAARWIGQSGNQMGKFKELHGWERTLQMFQKRADAWWREERKARVWRWKEEAEQVVREGKLETFGASLTYMLSKWRLIWGRASSPFCEAQWIGSIFECSTACAFMETHVHIHAWTHATLPLPSSDHYPSLHPQFAINLPNRSRPINLLDFRAAYLSPSHPLSFSPFHTIQSLSVSPPSHNSLLPRNCITFKIT